MIVALSLPALAAERPGAISGYVRDASGIPQMGAVVEIIGTAARTFTVFTDGAGFYSATDLLPGIYTVKVSAASFLPALRDKVGLHPGTSVHLNVTLNTLLNAMRVGPLRGTVDDDDWKWTLRSVANRPVLRVLDDPGNECRKAKSRADGQPFLSGWLCGRGLRQWLGCEYGFLPGALHFFRVPRRAEWERRIWGLAFLPPFCARRTRTVRRMVPVHRWR